MATLMKPMLLSNSVPARNFFNNTISILDEATAQIIRVMSSAIFHYNFTSKYRFGHCSPLEDLYPFRFLESQPHSSIFGSCTQEDYVGLVFTFLLTFLAVYTFICISNIISYTPARAVHPDTKRLHALERAVTRQIEIHYHLSRSSQNLGLSSVKSEIADSEKWALACFDIKCFREQAEKDWKRGLPQWYYENNPDLGKRYDELRNELARLQSLSQNIVNAREEALRYRMVAVDQRDITVINREHWKRRQINALRLAKDDGSHIVNRSGHGETSSRLKPSFQQQVDTTGRRTPGGMFG